MNLSNAQLKVIKDFCEEAEYEFRDAYSGRNMYGKSCIGLVVSKYESLFGVGGNMVQYIQSKIGKEISESDAQELIDEMLSEVYSDTMGRDDIIIYFNNIQMHEEDNDD